MQFKKKWITVITTVVSVIAIYLAITFMRGVSYYNRGTARMAEGQYDRAILCFDKAIAIEPEFAEAYCNRGTAYYEKGEYDRAILDFNKAIEINPEFADAYYNRAITHYHRQEHDKARRDVQKAQSLGYRVPPEFLEALRKTPEKQR
jgi:tetratricopeptide (TPR) repeat protein